jgi:hypothetical protein
MTLRPLLAAAVALLASLCPALAADPMVSNLTPAQRLETKPTDTTSEVSAATLELTHAK